MSAARTSVRTTAPHGGDSRRSRVRRHSRVSAVVVAVVTALAMTGCAGKSNVGGTTPTVTTPGSPAPTVSTATELVRVTGTVVDGAQPDCLVLDTGFSRYVLVGGDRADLAQAAEDQEEITVTGQAHTPARTSCSGGIPLAVEKVVPAA